MKLDEITPGSTVWFRPHRGNTTINDAVPERLTVIAVTRSKTSGDQVVATDADGMFKIVTPQKVFRREAEVYESLSSLCTLKANSMMAAAEHFAQRAAECHRAHKRAMQALEVVGP